VDVAPDGASVGVSPVEELLCEGILDGLDDGTLQWARPKGGFVTDLDEPHFGLLREVEAELAVRDQLLHFAQLDFDDASKVRLREGAEDDDGVDAVEELGTQEPLELLAENITQGVATFVRLEELHVGLEDSLRADVARHDDDGVREVGRAPSAVGQAPIVED